MSAGAILSPRIPLATKLASHTPYICLCTPLRSLVCHHPHRCDRRQPLAFLTRSVDDGVDRKGKNERARVSHHRNMMLNLVVALPGMPSLFRSGRLLTHSHCSETVTETSKACKLLSPRTEHARELYSQNHCGRSGAATTSTCFEPHSCSTLSLVMKTRTLIPHTRGFAKDPAT